MEKYKMHPDTARSSYFSSIETAKIIQDSIDLERRSNAASDGFASDLAGLVFLNEETGEETKFDLRRSPEAIQASEERIAKNEFRLGVLKEYIEEILEDYPELAQG